MATEGGDNKLTPEQEIDNIFTEYNTRLTELQNKLDTLTGGKPGASPKPPGFTDHRNYDKPETRDGIKSQMETLKLEGKHRAMQMANASPAASRQELDEKIEAWQNPDYKKQYEKKDIYQSEAYLLRARNAVDRQKQQKQPTIEPEIVVPSEVSGTKKSYSMSARFTTGLGYNSTNASISTGKEEKTPGIDPEKS